jgi:BlaI family transcriptional regulator, penicillinase repressor
MIGVDPLRSLARPIDRSHSPGISYSRKKRGRAWGLVFWHPSLTLVRSDMKDLNELTDLQLAILQQVWKRGSATVTDVHDSIVAETGLAKKTVGTIMSRLERQGLLEHEVEGREYVFTPTVSREEVGQAKVRNVLDRLFGGSLPALVSHALDVKDVRPGDVEKVRTLIEEWGRSQPAGKGE